MKKSPSQYDSPWKEVLERYFERFMAFSFPFAHTQIDWSRPPQFLDKELRKVTRDAQIGNRLADKLVKVWLLDGNEAWVLVHIEVQNQPELTFDQRMYVYNYRLFDRFGRRVASFAVLGDERKNWQPTQFGYELLGSEINFRYSVVKLLTYRERWAELEATTNPFALVVMAHLKAQETQFDAQARKEWKFWLVRRLYERGYQREDVINLFRFIDWVLELPPVLEELFWTEVQAYEEDNMTPYVTSVERIGIRKGLEQGLEQGLIQGRVETLAQSLLRLLQYRFQRVPASLLSQLQKLSFTQLDTLFEEALRTDSLETFLAQLNQLEKPDTP